MKQKPTRREISFSVPWTPRPKQGDRSRIVTTKTGRQFVQHYTATEVREDANSLASLAKEYVPKFPFQGPLTVGITATFPWLRSHPKKVVESGRSLPKDTKPDVDNIAKKVLDVLQSMGFFAGDQQIAHLRVTKEYGPAPRLRFYICEMFG